MSENVKIVTISDIPSDEKTRELTGPVCPERIPIWPPVTALRITMSLEDVPMATVHFHNARESGVKLKETVREHSPHSAGSPLTTLTSCESSAV